MEKFGQDFLLGAATAAHQVEGNNVHSDCWAMEQMQYSSFSEPSGEALDHYHRYREDIDLLAGAGLNAYRFGIEWARIEPQKGCFDEAEIAHYRDVLEYCRRKGVEPIVTMHHFSSPKWLIEQGGWEADETVDAFRRYCVYVVERLGSLMRYVCTINEANMGLQMASMMRAFRKLLEGGLQVGFTMPSPEQMQAQREEMIRTFGTENAQVFLSMRTEHGDEIIQRAHEAARDAMKRLCPHLQVGLTLSLHDIQAVPGGEAAAAREWEEEFSHYLPCLQGDDFFGLQNYTRKIFSGEDALPTPEGAELTQMGYEFYPEAVGNVIRRVYGELKKPILVTENGVAVTDDARRCAFLARALHGVQGCIADGIPVKGYCYWSLLDNFEWQKGFGMTFGLIAVNRATQQRTPKPSLALLGTYRG